MAKTKYSERKDNELRKGVRQRKTDGVYYYYYYDEEGKRRKITANSVDVINAKVDEIEKSKQDGLKYDKSNYTLNDYYRRWLTQIEVKPHTANNYSWLYEHYVEDTPFGKKKIKTIEKTEVIVFYKKLRDQKGLQISTIDSLQTVVRQVFQLAYDEQAIRKNPADGAMTQMKRQAPTKGQAHPALSMEQQKRFLSYVKKNETYSHWYNIFATLLGTGMRVGEIGALQWSDVDFDSGMISVSKTVVQYSDHGKMVIDITSPKTKGSTRTIPMLDMVREALISEKEKGQKTQKPIGEYSDFVFVSREGGPFQQGPLNKAIKRIVRDSNLEACKNDGVMLDDFSCHCFRATFITRAAERHIPLLVTMKVVGHTESRTTEQIYTTVSPDWQRDELGTLNDYLNRMNDDSN